MSKIRLVVADDHAVVREGLRTLLGSQTGLEVVGESATAEETVEVIRNTQPDVLTLDLSMRGWGGTAINPIRHVSPMTRIVVFSMHDDSVYVTTCMATGVLCYVLKSSPTGTLFKAIQSAARGQKFIDPKLNLSEEIKALPTELSKREWEVLELLTRGLTHQQIADHLYVSVKTVETYRARIRLKTGLKSRAELTQYGLNLGLLTHRFSVQNIVS
jgi:two-component system response regulator NreC